VFAGPSAEAAGSNDDDGTAHSEGWPDVDGPAITGAVRTALPERRPEVNVEAAPTDSDRRRRMLC